MSSFTRAPRAAVRTLTRALALALLALALWPASSAQVRAQSQVHAGLPPAVEKLPAPPLRPNVLLILADDMGVDAVAAYGEHPEPGNTPHIDALAAGGILFRNAWANATCSATRATLLTGRYAFRTGVGRVIDYDNSAFELSVDEVTLPDVLRAEHYRTAVVGKWHLAAKALSGPQHPLLLGFQHHRGPMSNLPGPNDITSYSSYTKSVDGVLTQASTYATTDQVDDALELIDSFGTRPWFLQLAFNAPHAPYHKPPAALHDFDLPPNVSDSIPLHHRAMAQAMDTELGRLLDSLGPQVLANTLVIFAGDNGTPTEATTPPFIPEHAKASLYEGGINVPLIVAGPGVAQGAVCSGLVNLTDVFATVAELAGADDRAALDSVSLVPYFAQPDLPSIRAWAYSQSFAPSGLLPTYATQRRTARDGRYKLITFYLNAPFITSIEFYDLVADPFELQDLLPGGLSAQQQASYDALAADMQQLQRW